MSSKENEAVKREKAKLPLTAREYDGLLPVSVLAALIGALLGIITATVFAYLTGIIFYPLFLAAPLLIYLFNSLLKGGRDIRALISAAVFSLASAYLTALACHEALYTAAANISIFQIPLRTVVAIGDPDVIPASASAYIYPFLFTACGVAVIWALFWGVRLRDLTPSDETDDEADDETDDETEDEIEDEIEDEADVEIDDVTEDETDDGIDDDADDEANDETDDETGDETGDETDDEID